MNIRIYESRVLAAGVLALLLIFFVSASVQAGTIQIPKGTKAKVKFPAGIKINSGNVSPGIPIICHLAEPIEVGGITVVEEGAQGTASVLNVEPAGKGGKPGRIKIEFASMDAKGDYKLLTNDKIKLTGTVEAEGKGKKLLSYLFIFGLFIKGGQGEIPTDVVYNAEVAESIVLESK